MNHVEVLNRPYLENELDRYGILDIAEMIIERVKEEVRNLASNVYEQFAIDARVLVGNVYKTITARFTMLENEEPPEDGEPSNTEIKYVEFLSLDQTDKG
ncbi:hypothetical protein [Geomicrobium sp. JCM 19055]|uniref:hypothetical protein n=1 Tax=Geomicrobium sp. JCM 19055 TaxID=1460649 RepID=UPI00045EDD01|nr:hypothetical protein [Geomicrobium sp. JCM 19055]GAJ99570.1 hypothetical protein JCM19055_2578 [Geomicrobium sp. JCM 19055]